MTKEPVLEVVELLESILEKAKKGEVRAVGLAIVEETGNQRQCRSQWWRPEIHAFDLIAATRFLEHLLVQDTMNRHPLKFEGPPE